MNTCPLDIPVLSQMPLWLTPPDAASILGCTRQELIRLVKDRELTVHQLPDGSLTISAADLSALRTPVPADEAARLLFNNFTKDTTMQQVETDMQLPAMASIDARQIFQKIEELITMTRREASAAPTWLDIEAAVARFGAPAKTVKEWAKCGFVRKSKLGPTFQSKTLYNADDIDAVLNRIAIGKTPVVALREVG